MGEHLQLGGPVGGRGDVIDELQLAVGFQQAGVRPDGVHPDTVETLGGGDQRVWHGAGRQFDHQVVDGVSRSALDDVERQDVGADRAQGDGKRAEATGPIDQLDLQQIRRHAATLS